MINQSRADLTGNVPWIVAKTSHQGGETSPVVIQGQNLVVDNASLIFAGPNTDNDVPLSSRRTGGGEPTHYNTNGLNLAAESWYQAVRSILLTNPAPVTIQYLGTQPRNVQLAGSSVFAPPGSAYLWANISDGTANLNTPIATTQQLPYFGSGSYVAFTTNSQGNYIITQAVAQPYSQTEEPTTPPSNSCTTFSELCSGNEQEIRNVTINVASPGNYPLTVSYKSAERAVATSVLVDGNPTAINYSHVSGYTTATTGSVYLSQGAHTIGLRSSSQGGFVCFNSVCVGDGGGTTSTQPQPPAGGNPGNGAYEGYLNGADCGGIYG